MNQSIYIIINNDGISGSEKRIISVWKSLVEKGHKIYLVISKKNYEILNKNSEFELSSNLKKKIIKIFPKKNSYIAYFISLLKIRNLIKNNSIVHFPLIYSPLFLFKKNITLVTSWNANYKPNLNYKIHFKIYILIWISFYLSKKIDILNFSNFEYLSKFKFLKNKIFLNSGGSFTSFDIFKPNLKKNYVTLLSRFTEGKGVIEFLNCIPLLDKEVNQLKIPNVEIHICGRGELHKNILERLNKTNLKNIKVNIYFIQNPEKILSQSKIFLSLQKRSNYPSKSLIEAMASGCIPIITNTGDSKKMLEEEHGYYINQNINEKEICKLIIKILRFNDKEFQDKSTIIRDLTIKKFNIQNSIKYYSNLYNII